MSGGHAMMEEVNNRLRSVLRGVMEARPWDQRRAAAELGIKQQSISSFLSGNTGASLYLAWEIAKASGYLLDDILNGGPLRTRRALRESTAFGDSPVWRHHEPAARALYSYIPARAFDAVAAWSGVPPPVVNPLVIGALAEVWWKAEASRPVDPAEDTVIDVPLEEASGERARRR